MLELSVYWQCWLFVPSLDLSMSRVLRLWSSKYNKYNQFTGRPLSAPCPQMSGPSDGDKTCYCPKIVINLSLALQLWRLETNIETVHGRRVREWYLIFWNVDWGPISQNYRVCWLVLNIDTDILSPTSHNTNNVTPDFCFIYQWLSSYLWLIK